MVEERCIIHLWPLGNMLDAMKILPIRLSSCTTMLTWQNAERFSERIGNVADKLEQCAVAEHSGGSGTHLGGTYAAGESHSGGASKEESALQKSTQNRCVRLYTCIGEATERLSRTTLHAEVLRSFECSRQGG